MIKFGLQNPNFQAAASLHRASEGGRLSDKLGGSPGCDLGSQLPFAGSGELPAAARPLVWGAHPPSVSAGTQDGAICLSHPLLLFAIASLRSAGLDAVPGPTRWSCVLRGPAGASRCRLAPPLAATGGSEGDGRSRAGGMEGSRSSSRAADARPSPPAAASAFLAPRSLFVCIQEWPCCGGTAGRLLRERPPSYGTAGRAITAWSGAQRGLD